MAQRARIGRGLLLLILPLLAAYGVYRRETTRDMPMPKRVAQPPLPAKYQNLTNPLRNASDALARYTEEGRVLYEKNCSPCHGVTGSGDGPMARAFRLRPSNFNDRTILATVPTFLSDSYLFWRIKEGGIGLPPESTPWDSAMPAWGGELSDEEIWKIILGIYDVADLGPSPPSTDLSDVHLRKIKIADGPEMQTLGQAVYRKRCSVCHGEAGRGDGPIADYLFPRPRDLRRGLFKLRSTNDLPTDEDLFRTLARGIAGTSMPAWGTGDWPLPERERWAVIHYIKTFYPDFKDAQSSVYKNLLAMDPRPADSEAARRHGAEIFLREDRGACMKCHGRQGRGDGRESGTHRDDFGFPILPANLTQRWRLKNWGSSSPEGLYRSVSLGLQGTVMPSYMEAFNPQDPNQDRNDRWSLAYFIHSLGEEEKRGGALLRAPYAADLPGDPADARWYGARVPALGVPLAGQLITKPRWLNPSVDYLTVRALYNDQAVAFLLVWDDRFKNATHTEPPAPRAEATADTYGKVDYNKLAQSYARSREGAAEGLFRDAAAIQFPVRPEGPPPYFFLGQPDSPVNLWWWKADWQENAAAHRGTGAEEINAAGAHRPHLERPSSTHGVQSRARYENGRWSVVMIRARATEHPEVDAQFRPGVRLPIAFHVWDGAHREEGLRRAISGWYYLQLEPSFPLAAYGYALAAFVLALGLEMGILKMFGHQGTKTPS